ncbi:MAG: hypothetical protein RR821_10640, partial [Clostridia bacterium]
MQTIQRIKQELRKGGLGPFLRHMLHSLAGLRYNLVREPAEALQPCPATDAFMSTLALAEKDDISMHCTMEQTAVL